VEVPGSSPVTPTTGVVQATVSWSFTRLAGARSPNEILERASSGEVNAVE
jgi:hypothetical protein